VLYVIQHCVAYSATPLFCV